MAVIDQLCCRSMWRSISVQLRVYSNLDGLCSPRARAAKGLSTLNRLR